MLTNHHLFMAFIYKENDNKHGWSKKTPILKVWNLDIFFRKARVTKLLVQILFGDRSTSEVTQKRLMIFMYQICPVETDKIMEDSLKNYTT